MTKNHLHWLISIEVCLALFIEKMGLSGLGHTGLDEALQTWLVTESQRDLAIAEHVAYFITSGIGPLFLFSWVWLWLLKPYSRILYVLISLPSFLLPPLLGPHVSNGWPEVFTGFSSLVTGMIISVLYFTDVYKKKPSSL